MIDDPVFRALQIFAFDPGHGRSLGNHMTVHVPWEPLLPGPAGRRLVVVDYDATTGAYLPPVDLDDPRILARGGLPPSESEPAFHQQMVYAAVAQTLRHFERALGRPVRWAFDRNQPEDRPLRVLPHGMREANAFYSRDLQALAFGYFAAGDATQPGETIFTCLSHDVVVHETTHALVDGMRRYFQEPTSHDTLAFHEALADLVALFSHFACTEALLETIQRTGGRIHEPHLPALAGEAANPLVQLARQFGEALGLRGALRSAIGEVPDPHALARATSPHDRGAILVAAVFEAYFTIYARRTEDLYRIAGLGSSTVPAGGLPAELAARLADTAAKLARQFLSLCIRALDYCPPVDVTFGDYLRALITADCEHLPHDRHGYRQAIVDAFRRRHIVPRGVGSLSEDTLRWQPPWHGAAPRCEGLAFDPIRRVRDPGRNSRNARILHRFADENRAPLGLDRELPINVYSFDCVSRVSPAGDPQFGFVAELVQTRQHELRSGRTIPVRGGVTLVLDPDGDVRYAIGRPLDAGAIAARADFAASFAASPVCKHDAKELRVDFRALHARASAAAPGGLAPFPGRPTLGPHVFRALHPHVRFGERDEQALCALLGGDHSIGVPPVTGTNAPET